VSYDLKRPELTVPIARGVVNGSAHRQIARVAGCAPSTVSKRVARLGRHAPLLHQLCVAALPGIDEPLNYDDFETFTGLQYHPCGESPRVFRRPHCLRGWGLGRRSRYSPEVRERAVRPLLEHQGEHGSQWAAIGSIA
jgi:hypothetical protein